MSDILNHAELALARLPEQYKAKPKIAALMNALMIPVQKIENALIQLRDERLSLVPGVVQGVNLDLLGAIVGQERVAGESDSGYLTNIIVKIGRNTSQGDPEAVMRLFNTSVGASSCFMIEYRASIIIFSSVALSSQTQINQVFIAVEASLPVGVRCNELGYFDPTNAFSFEGNLPGLGFADDAVPGSGGLFAEGYLRNDKQFAFAGDDLSGYGFGSDFDPLAGGVFVGP